MSRAQADAGAELAALTHALRAELRRRAHAGRRSVPRTAGGPPLASASSEAPAEPAAPQPSAAAAPSSLADPVPGSSPADVRARAAACGSLAELAEAVSRCRACPLAETRTQTVFGDGDGSAGAMFVGEAPGFHEDREGVPFVGRAGALLTDIIEKGMGLSRRHTYIGNVLKCRPPDNRDPTASEKALCTPWLDRQIELVDPAVLIPLGRHAAGHLLRTDAPMGKLRGRAVPLPGSAEPRRVVPTYHPAFLLRTPSAKKDCWRDIQVAMAELGLEPPRRG